MDIVIVTGEKGGGKSTYISTLMALSDCAGGFLSIHRSDGYYLKNVETGEERLFLSSEPVFDKKFKEWYCNPDALEWANGELDKIHSGDVFIDEVGMMEVSGSGFSPSLKVLLKRDVKLTLSVRKAFLDKVIEAFGITSASVIDVSQFLPIEKSSTLE